MLNALRDIFVVNLGVKRTERALVFTDAPSRKETVAEGDALRRRNLRDVAALAAEVGRCYAKEIIFVEYPATGGHGVEPPAKLWDAAFGPRCVEALKEAGLFAPLLKKRLAPERFDEVEKLIRRMRKSAVDVVVALSNYSTTHTAFRQLLTRLCGCRYASMPLFDVPMLEGPMNVDYKALAKRTRLAASALSSAASVELMTPNGTKLSFSIKGRKAKADTGLLRTPGSSGNLPAGEAFLAPVEGTANGKLVLEWAPTRKLSSPVTLSVADGLVVGIGGADPFASVLRGKLAERKENSNVAELGIGTNDMAKRPDNILESEKILGTVHIALGDNSSFGGGVKTPFHQDFVFFRPTLTLMDGTGRKKILLKNGKISLPPE